MATYIMFSNLTDEGRKTLKERPERLGEVNKEVESMGARVSFHSGKPTVTDGPFIEAKEVLGGYWMIQVKSRQEAIEWAKRCPGSDNETIEIRQVMEMADFPPDVKEAAAGFSELLQKS